MVEAEANRLIGFMMGGTVGGWLQEGSTLVGKVVDGVRLTAKTTKWITLRTGMLPVMVAAQTVKESSLMNPNGER